MSSATRSTAAATRRRREIGEAVGLTSTSSVAHQLRVLERKGFLRRDPNRPRALDVRLPATPRSATSADAPARERPAGRRPTCRCSGRIAAGGPILAEEAVEDVFPLPRELVGEGTLFLLKVVGDSMVDAAICDGDWVVVRQQPTADNGDIVAAMIDGEATVKTFKRTRRSGLADAAQPGVRADPRRRRDHPRQGRHRAAPDLTRRL